ncbi:MAG TPA: NYN domain-containing protein [Thermoanaerobaculia bacterium]|nr:NYN domain-containing protein [Thermoanaerobaculia bacterium]
MNGNERKIALFIDFENIAIGVREAKHKKFEIALLLERLLEKGKLVVKRAYCDWDKFPDYKRELHEAAIELIDIPARAWSGKNSADIRMAVDAMDMAWSKEHIDLFVIASGDSDFSPLVSKLKENDKFVIGVGVKNSSSDLLIDNCDEFIFYEDLVRVQRTQRTAAPAGKDKKQAECFKLLIDSIKALMRENKEILWGSMVKQTMQRKRPTFNEEYYGYDTFSNLLEDAQENNIIRIKKDPKSGSYIITGFAQQE